MCTAFVLKNEKSLLLAHNYDYYFGHGMIFANPRGWKKTAISMSGPAGTAWTAKYGSVTFNQYGRELPVCGMNERGLAIAMLAHNDGEYPEPDDRPALNELQWIQYQLDVCGTVQDVLDRLDRVRIEKTMQSLHYMLADATGDAAVIEFYGNETRIARGGQALAVTNSGMDDSIRHAERLKDTPLAELSGRLDSLNRYTLACRLTEEAILASGENPLGAKDALSVLQRLSVSPSAASDWAWEGSGVPTTFTQWRTVFDVRQRIISHQTSGNPSTRHFSLDRFSFAADEPVLCLDLEGASSGNPEQPFKPYAREHNERLIRLSFAPVADRFPPGLLEELVQYPETFVRE